MPFTPTHILAVLPFWRLRRLLPFAGLAIGAVVSDLPIFFPFISSYEITHSPMGALTVCLPLAILIFLFFELVLRFPLTALLPQWFRQRLVKGSQIPKNKNIKQYLLYFLGLIVALLIGIYSHQIWDSFTHEGRWGVRLIPSLNSESRIGDYVVLNYKLFQYGSTFIGLPLLALFTVLTLRRTKPHSEVLPVVRLQWKLFVALFVFMSPLLTGLYFYVTCIDIKEAVGLTIRRSGVMIFIGLSLYCVLFSICKYRD